MAAERNLSLYIHWPFCKSKCPYCDFNSHIFDTIEHTRWAKAYLKEIDYYSSYLKDKQIKTIFFGGGTPSLMEPSTIDSIINHLYKNYDIAADLEITMEANPTSFEVAKFGEFKNAGVNRISIGIQSFNQNDLVFLGREHSVVEAKHTIEYTSKLFNNYSFDLIYARPNQTIGSWQNELEEAIQFAGTHISLYQLTIEKGTKFFKLYKEGKLKLPEEEISEDLYIFTKKFLESHGLFSYEISNYAKKGFESQHNLSYWRYKDYLGIGPGAHSRINIEYSAKSLMNIHNPDKWLNTVEEKSNGLQNDVLLSNKDMVLEYILMGLRIEEGIDLNRLLKVTKFSSTEDIFIQKKLDWFRDNGYLKINENKLSLTLKGWLIYNNLIVSILRDEIYD